MNDARLTFLVNRYLDGQLGHGERTEFEAVLRYSSAAREQFWHEAKLHALLHEAEKSGVAASAHAPARRLPRRSRVALIFLAAAAGLAVVVLWGAGTWRSSPVQTPSEPTTTAIAVLSRSLDATWRSPAETHAIGDALQPGWLHLASGLAHVEFYNGVRVVLEGPSDFQLISGRQTHLSNGRLRAEVPPVARGFSVTTPKLQVVDLGTEFGLSVRPSQEEVHVFQGHVTLQTALGLVHDVRAGNAIAVVNDAEPIAIAPAPSDFANAADLGRKTQQAQDQQLAVWQQTTLRLDADPTLLLHFDFAKAAIDDRTLSNRVVHDGAVEHGLIVGCAPAEGRWPGKQALAFRQESDRVRVRVPGEHHALTLLAWVRVDTLERLFNSLFMTDAFNVGALHWQIRGNGSLHLGISAPPGQSAERYNFDSPDVFTTERLGKWVQVAMVYDGEKRRMMQYVDGSPAGDFTLAEDVALRIEHAELGNWNPINAHDGAPIRNLTGRMDEFMLFSRSLAAGEIRDLYLSGAGGATSEKK